MIDFHRSFCRQRDHAGSNDGWAGKVLIFASDFPASDVGWIFKCRITGSQHIDATAKTDLAKVVDRAALKPPPHHWR